MRYLWLLCLLVLGLSACGTDATPTPTAEVVQTDIPTLVAGMNLPADPIAVQWVENAMGTPSSAPGPTDYELVAVMEFTPDVIEQFKAGPPNNQFFYVSETFLRDWFPESVREGFIYDESLEQFRLDAPSYPATPFEKNAYQGRFFIVGNYVVLQMYKT
jgi:hypothetical protein